MAEQSSHVIVGGVPPVITEFCNFRFLYNATTECYNCLGKKLSIRMSTPYLTSIALKVRKKEISNTIIWLLQITVKIQTHCDFTEMITDIIWTRQYMFHYLSFVSLVWVVYIM
jgi:hypothetical protein